METEHNEIIIANEIKLKAKNVRPYYPDDSTISYPIFIQDVETGQTEDSHIELMNPDFTTNEMIEHYRQQSQDYIPPSSNDEENDEFCNCCECCNTYQCKYIKSLFILIIVITSITVLLVCIIVSQTL